MLQLKGPLQKKFEPEAHEMVCDKIAVKLKWKESLNLFTNVLKARPADKREGKNKNICSSVTHLSLL